MLTSKSYFASQSFANVAMSTSIFHSCAQASLRGVSLAGQTNDITNCPRQYVTAAILNDRDTNEILSLASTRDFEFAVKKAIGWQLSSSGRKTGRKSGIERVGSCFSHMLVTRSQFGPGVRIPRYMLSDFMLLLRWAIYPLSSYIPLPRADISCKVSENWLRALTKFSGNVTWWLRNVILI